MSTNALKKQLEIDYKQGRLPKAIIVAHIYGQSANIEKIIKIADHYNVKVIEDAPESLGAKYNGKPSGSHGLLSIFSLMGIKLLQLSSGGALASNSPKLIEKAQYLSTQGRDSYDHYQHSQIAYNYRMSNVLASIGLGQLEVLDERVKKRRILFEQYKKKLRMLKV